MIKHQKCFARNGCLNPETIRHKKIDLFPSACPAAVVGLWVSLPLVLPFFSFCFISFQNSWVTLTLYCCSAVLWSIIKTALLHLAEPEETVCFYALRISSDYFGLLSHHQLTPVTQCHRKPRIPMYIPLPPSYQRCCVLQIMSCSNPPHTFVPSVIQVQVDLKNVVGKLVWPF